MRKIWLIMVSLFICPSLIRAAQFCTAEETSNARQFATNVNIYYEISMINEKPQFKVILTNLTNDMIIIDKQTAKSYSNFSANGSEFTINTSNNGNYSFEIYSKKCKIKLGDKAVVLPAYNPYYADPLCDGLEAYSQCQRWSGYSANRETFEKDINKIKQDLSNQQQEPSEENEKVLTWYEQLTKWFLNYWWIVVICMLIVIFIFYLLWSKKKKNEYNFDV